MIVKMYDGCDETLLFAVDSGGNAIGLEDYFKLDDKESEGNRDIEDYTVSLIEFPLLLASTVTVNPNRFIAGR